MHRIVLVALALCLAGPAIAGTMDKNQSSAPKAPAQAGSSMPRDYKVQGLTLSDSQQKAVWNSVADATSQKAPKHELKIGQKVPDWVTLKPLPQQAKDQLGVVADAYHYAKIGDRVVLAERDNRRVADIITE